MKFFGSIEKMRSNPPQYSDPFIVQWEIPHPKDDRERMYIVFDGLSEYLRMLSNGRYNTCHELFIDQCYNSDSDIIGHPAFDIDSIDPLPDGWVKEMEKDIISILSAQYPLCAKSIQDKLSISDEWVWLTSPSKKKLSRHLTIRGITFTTWRSQMKILMEDLLKIDSSYNKAIDEAIYRRKGSLRLPLNSKKHKTQMIDGLECIIEHSYPIYFDNPNHTFLDGIIIIHNSNLYTAQNSVFLSPTDLLEEYRYRTTYIAPSTGVNISDQEDIDVSPDKLIQSFNHIDRAYNTGLVIGTLSGKYLPLNRVKPGKCPISGRIHETENAYIYESGGKIMYSCHRGCSIKVDTYIKKSIDITYVNLKEKEDIVRACSADIDRYNKSE